MDDELRVRKHEALLGRCLPEDNGNDSVSPDSGGQSRCIAIYATNSINSGRWLQGCRDRHPEELFASHRPAVTSETADSDGGCRSARGSVRQKRTGNRARLHGLLRCCSAAIFCFVGSGCQALIGLQLHSLTPNSGGRLELIRGSPLRPLNTNNQVAPQPMEVDCVFKGLAKRGAVCTRVRRPSMLMQTQT